MGNNRHVHLDLEPFNVNGVIHVGAGEGEFADYYHKLGVNKVLWLEKDEHKYKDIYASTCKYGMDQQILITNVLDYDATGYKKFVTLWRQNGSYIDMDTYDLLHVAAHPDRLMIMEGFDFLVDFFKEILFTDKLDMPDPGQIAPLESYLARKGFVLHSHICESGRNEFLFSRRS